jgi:hypothetical protein
MRKNIILIKAFCIAALIFFQINLKAQENKVIYSVNGKLITYYALSHDSLKHISVTGPGKLTIITRARFSGNSTDSISYGIVYVCDNTKLKVYKVKKVVRDAGKVDILSSDEVPSIAKSFTIKVDPDIHDYSFVMQNESPQVDLRYKFIPDTIPEWRDISSLNDTAKIKLEIEKSAIQSYYRFSSASPKKFKVKGPASLRVITRLEYDYTMQGSLSYRVQVKKNDIIVGTYKLSTNPSVESQYVNDRKHVPGLLKKFYFDVPAGDNIYEFSLLDKQFSALIRVSKQKK